MFKRKATICVIAATMLTVMTLFCCPLPNAPLLETFTIRAQTLQNICMLDGEAVAADQMPIVALSAGRVTQVCVKSGEHVKAGQLLVRLDATYETEALAALQSQLFQLGHGLQYMSGSHLTALTQTQMTKELVKQQAALQAAIETKQIRAQTSGIVNDLFVDNNMYLESATPIGTLCGEGLQVTAWWPAKEGQPPVLGTAALWCAQDGTPLETLVLEKVSAPIQMNGSAAHPLVFRMSSGNKINLVIGDKAPIRLLKESIQAQAVVPIEALDDTGQIWLLRNGNAVPIVPERKGCDHLYLQVQNSLVGECVILHPEKWALEAGAKPRKRVKE